MSRTAANPVIESRIACGFLVCVVDMQILAAVSKAVRQSAGYGGRMMYYTAFGAIVVHGAFIALAVPASLLWVALELLRGVREVETLLAAIVGTLWYGPDRVQNALTNLFHICHRRQILLAALSPYHRRNDQNVLRRQPRRWPWWTGKEKDGYWYGKEVSISEGTVCIADAQLRSIARKGIDMAFTGNADVNTLRNWCAALVADQARYGGSLLEDTNEFSAEETARIFGGPEGKCLMACIAQIDDAWTPNQWMQLARVIERVKTDGLTSLFESGWVLDDAVD